MTARHFYRAPSGDFVEMTARVKIGDWEVTHNAEEATVGQGKVTVQDPLGELDFVGHRQWVIYEDEITDPDETIFFYGYTYGQKIKRGDSELTAAARIWEIELQDVNVVLSRRIQVGADAKRPAESDTARINWMMGTVEAGAIDDHRFIFPGHTTQMDAVDYNGQRNYDVVNDCAQASGKNYYLLYFQDTAQVGIWYGHAGLPDYEAGYAISNVLSDIDGDGVFAISKDTELNRDPSRQNSGVYLPYDGGYIYVTSPSIAASVAVRDVSMPSVNVKTSAKAKKRANRYLADIATQEQRTTTTVLVPPTHMNKAKAGQLINYRATHEPGFESFTALRILKRTVRQLTPKWYKVDFELSAGDILPAAGNATARLYSPFNRDGLDLYPDIGFHTTGDVPQAGRLYWPLTGALAYVHNDIDDFYSGIEVTGDGDVDITLSAGIAAVVNGTTTITLDILVNGSIVGTHFETSTGGLRFVGPNFIAVAEGISVTAGDVVTGMMTIDPEPGGGGKVPQGTGFPNQYLEVTGTLE